MFKIVITETHLKKIIENNKIKKGSPEELVEMLKYLPVDETAIYLADEIYQDLLKYYSEDKVLVKKEYTYHPNIDCLEPYVVEIDFFPSNNMPNIGFANQHYIQLKYLNKMSNNFSSYGENGGVDRLYKQLRNIIKHECSHFYLEQKGIENCLYYTHPHGMKKYYHDRQEMVLHSREIFETFTEWYPEWKNMSLDRIISIIGREVKNLQNHTNIYYPYTAALQKKYLNFIINTYVKPFLN
jgi:hypothetical protein